MIAHIAYAEGSPCPTVVLSALGLPRQTDELCDALRTVRAALLAAGDERVLKFALISPSSDPWVDVDYRFAQCIPGQPDHFDLTGSCGHSIVAAVIVAERLGWVPRLEPAARVRVAVLNNGDRVVCEAADTTGTFTVHFKSGSVSQMGDALLTGEVTTELVWEGRRSSASLVSAGNAYAFVDARTLGVRTQDALFADDETLFAKLAGLREAAVQRLGFPPDGVFPKIAAIGAYERGRLAARAISVPTWHPTLALTGAVCLGVASAIAGTVPYDLARRVGLAPGKLVIDTPGGPVEVAASISGTKPDDSVFWTSVSGVRAHMLKTVSLDSRQLEGRAADDLKPTVVPACPRRVAGGGNTLMPGA